MYINTILKSSYSRYTDRYCEGEEVGQEEKV